jgi:hypothetical protein
MRWAEGHELPKLGFEEHANAVGERRRCSSLPCGTNLFRPLRVCWVLVATLGCSCHVCALGTDAAGGASRRRSVVVRCVLFVSCLCCVVVGWFVVCCFFVGRRPRSFIDVGCGDGWCGAISARPSFHPCRRGSAAALRWCKGLLASKLLFASAAKSPTKMRFLLALVLVLALLVLLVLVLLLVLLVLLLLPLLLTHAHTPRIQTRLPPAGELIVYLPTRCPPSSRGGSTSLQHRRDPHHTLRHSQWKARQSVMGGIVCAHRGGECWTYVLVHAPDCRLWCSRHAQ